MNTDFQIVSFQNEDKQENKNEEKSLKNIDPDSFINLSEQIYNKGGFNDYADYYFKLQDVNRFLINILFEIFDNLNNEDFENLNINLGELIKIREDFLDFIKIYEYVFPMLYTQIETYFNNIKIEQVDHEQNGEFIVSQLQIEWHIRMEKMSKTYSKYKQIHYESQMELDKNSNGLTWKKAMNALLFSSWYSSSDSKSKPLAIKPSPPPKPPPPPKLPSPPPKTQQQITYYQNEGGYYQDEPNYYYNSAMPYIPILM